MKKLLLTIATVSAQLVAMAQWTIFPGTASEISCGSATEFACIGGSSIFKYNFGTSAYVQMTGVGYNLNGVALAADGTLLGKSNLNFTASSNLIKFNAIPAVANAFNTFNGVINNNISVLNQNYYIGSTGGNTVNNIYQWNGSAWSVLPGSTSTAAKKVVAGAGPTIYAMNWSATGNNIIVYTVGANIWSALSNSTLNAIDISVSDATKVLAVDALGKLYYRFGGAWVLDATAPADLIRVSAASDGTVMLLTSAGVIYKNTWANITCGTSLPVPVNTTASQNLNICSGQSTTLTATGTGTLNWSGASSGTGATLVTPSLTTTATYSITNTVAGCTSLPTVLTVTVNAIPPTPIFSGPGFVTVCSGTTVSIPAFSSGPISWFASPTSTTALATGTVYTTPTLSTNVTYYISTTSNGCESPRAVKTVTVKPTPNAPVITGGDFSICNGYTANLYSDIPCEWYTVPTGGSYVFGMSTGVYFYPSITTTYYADVTFNGCSSFPRTAITVTVSTCTGIMEAQELNSISLQPNPASTYFTLGNVAEGTSVNVIDVTGKVVVSDSVIDADKTMTIETSNLPNGVYMIQLKNNGAVAHKKLVISK